MTDDIRPHQGGTMANNLIEIKCPRCGYVWREDVTQLEKTEETMMKLYRAADARPRITSYRARCPNDYTWVIVDVEEVPDA
jgi:hypothetical protein